MKCDDRDVHVILIAQKKKKKSSHGYRQIMLRMIR